MNELSDWLNKTLDDKGWSQRELARRSGVSATTINDVINEKANPGWKFCVSIAEALREEPQKILQRAGLMPFEEQKKEETIEELIREIHNIIVGEEKEGKENKLAEAKALYLAEDTTTEELVKVIKGLNHQDRVALLQYAHFLASERGGTLTASASA